MPDTPIDRNQPHTITSEDEIRAYTVGEPKRVDGAITLVEYDPAWPASYEQEAAKIRAVLGERIVSLEHIGSTSVPGLCAKPIIDIQLLVADSSDEPDYADALVAAGYRLHIREPEWEEHRAFKGVDPDVNLHVFSHGCRIADRHLAFRDAIRADDAERDRYAATKRELAAQTWAYTQNYADAKNDVIDAILARAGNTIPRV